MAIGFFLKTIMTAAMDDGLGGSHEVTHPKNGDRLKKNIVQGLDVLRQGRVLLVNTDTVPGMAVSPFLPQAVSEVYRLKGRDRKKFLVWMVADFQILSPMLEIPTYAEPLIKRYWPGDLTLIFRVKDRSHPFYPWTLTRESFGSPNRLDGFSGESLAVRIPAGDRYLIALLKCLDEPLAVTSVNHSGGRELRTWKKIRQEFGEDLDYSLYLSREDFWENQENRKKQPSTVIDVREGIKIIRQGRIVIDVIGRDDYSSYSP